MLTPKRGKKSMAMKRVLQAAAIACALSSGPAYGDDKNKEEEIISVRSAWHVIIESACSIGVDTGQVSNIPKFTAVTISYTKNEPEPSYIIVCYRGGETSEWLLWTVVVAEGGSNRGVVTLGPYQNAFQVATNAVINGGTDNVAPMARYVRNKTYGGIAFDYFEKFSSRSANTRIDLTMSPPPDK